MYILDEDLPEILVEMLSHNNLVVHYYCVVILNHLINVLIAVASTDLRKREEDSSGIRGFVIKDIREEALKSKIVGLFL